MKKKTVVCAVYHDMHDDDSGMWTKKESGEEKIGKRQSRKKQNLKTEKVLN